MAVFEVRGGPINKRYLMNKRRSDLSLMLSDLARHPHFTRSDVADAILLLTRRLPDEIPNER